MSRPWMPLYVADYLVDTAHLDAAESGAYLHLIMSYWVNGSLPKEDQKLARIARMTTKQWNRSKATIKLFFDPEWRHTRIDRELAQVVEISNKRKAAAEQMHANRDAKASANADTLHTSHTQSKKEVSKPETREDALSVREPSDFEIFWCEWPNKVGKPSAMKALASALRRGASFAAIIAGIQNYIRDKPPDRPWLNPATFLNQNRWEDRPAPTAIVKALTAHQQKQAEGKGILDDIGEFISSHGGEANSRLLRHDPGIGPESLRGGAGGNLVELSAGSAGKSG